MPSTAALRDVVMLGMWFSVRSSAASEAPIAAYPDDDLLSLTVETVQTDHHVILHADAVLDDPRLPFELTVAFEAHFNLTEAQVDLNAIEPHLLWAVHPYLREIITDVTGRSSCPRYVLRPLTGPPRPEQTL
jgi:hypothetical protein